jgi:hypothetical protein
LFAASALALRLQAVPLWIWDLASARRRILYLHPEESTPKNTQKKKKGSLIAIEMAKTLDRFPPPGIEPADRVLMKELKTDLIVVLTGSPVLQTKQILVMKAEYVLKHISWMFKR